MTELGDSNTIARRGIRLPVTGPVKWRRRVGGRFGPTVELPAGCISDDTQLRLATSRSIRGDGVFDAETFAKVELTVWPAYALGAGRGSQEAAANLRRRDVSWATNFFDADRSVYVNGGGNGAAMRVQPHVWSSGRHDKQRWRTDVIVNAVCTHGHMRGILGALFHAGCLRRALEDNTVPGPDIWAAVADELYLAVQIIQKHDHLEHLWLGLWEARSDTSLEAACDKVVRELKDGIRAVEAVGDGAGGYNDAVEALGAYRPEDRGSGVKTALLAAVAAKLFERQPQQAMETCANRLGTDTDSIGTMAGALIGATLNEGPDVELADRAYIKREAERMWAIGEGLGAPNFPYPTLMSWSPPRSQLDCVGRCEGGLVVAGLGPITTQHKIVAGSGKNASAWGWVDLWFGQRVLIKQRARPEPLPHSQLVPSTARYITASLLDETPVQAELNSVSAEATSAVSDIPPADGPRTLHRITNDVIAADFDPATIGYGLLELAQREDGIELAAQYAAILAKARLTRQDRERRR